MVDRHRPNDDAFATFIRVRSLTLDHIIDKPVKQPYETVDVQEDCKLGQPIQLVVETPINDNIDLEPTILSTNATMLSNDATTLINTKMVAATDNRPWKDAKVNYPKPAAAARGRTLGALPPGLPPAASNGVRMVPRDVNISERQAVINAQYKMLAELEDAWDENEEEEMAEDKRAAEEAEAAAAAARRRREVALRQLNEANEKLAEEAAHRKEEAALASAKRREDARARARATLEGKRAAARKVGRDLFRASAVISAPSLTRGSASKSGSDDEPELTRASSSFRTISMRRGASAAAAVGRIRQKSAPALAQVSAIGHSVFGFALGMRGRQRRMSFSLVRYGPRPPGPNDDAFDPNRTRPPMKIRCPCGMCGHLNMAVIDDSKINRGQSDEGQMHSVRVICEACDAGMTVRVTKRDAKLSI